MIYSRVYYRNSYYTKIKLPSVFCNKYLIIWKPNHITNNHYHNGKKCEFTLLYGSLKQIVFKNNNSKKINKLNKYEINYIDDEIGSHKIINYDKISLSYHKYY